MGYDMVLLTLFHEKHQFSSAGPLCNETAFYDWEFLQVSIQVPLRFGAL